MAKNTKTGRSYVIEVVGEAVGPISGAVPDDIDSLTVKPDKDLKSLIYQVVKADVDMRCQAGDIAGAWKAIKTAQQQEHEYAAPLNTFKRDAQNGGSPYLGAHCLVGAFRDAAKLGFLDEYKFYQKKGDKGPSAKHLRKFVRVKPYHIFLRRPNVNGNIIDEVDEAGEGQQPVGDVRGFARYDVIHPPFQFAFDMIVSPRGLFAKPLGNRELVEETLRFMVNFGLGSRRSAGYGMWKIVSLNIQDHRPD